MNRFVLRKRLGEGGMGVVFRAHDRERDRDVALKTMRYPEPEEIYRLKREFRTLAGISHPNLVSLYELFVEGDECFFTMEAVEGTDMLHYVRGKPATPSLEPVIDPLPPAGCDRLRRGLGQLAVGLEALHAAGKLHRDLKPSNVMVTHDGRVVVLDFGLATTYRSPTSGVTDHRQMVGTVSYMPPEQGFGGPVSAASDWYSVGVMLYEALTGRVPFVGSPLRVMLDKSQLVPPSPRTLAPELPEDLDALTMRLLAREPGERPTGRDVLAVVGVELGHSAPTLPAAVALAQRGRLVGREAELAELHRALTTSDTGAVVVHVHGPSGVGKTALLERFVAEATRDGDVTVLAGRCYLQESVPFKALDGVVDTLSKQLVELRGAELRAVCPEGPSVVARLFPVLGRIESLAFPLGERAPVELEPRELRRRAITELREIVGRLARRTKLVVWIDDLQWGDLDSAGVLRELIAPPDAPPIVYVLSYRTADRASSAVLKELFEIGGAGASKRGDTPVLELPIAPLSAGSVRELAEELLAAVDRTADRPQVDAIVSESGGNPFFAWELARHFLDVGMDHGNLAVSLAGLVRHRVERLSGSTQRLLEVVAVAGGPLDGEVAFRAAGIRETSLGALSALGAESLLRQTPSGERACFDVYHDRIRTSVLDQLSADVRKTRHREIAEALGAAGRVEPRMLSEHWAGAGEHAYARRHALEAAEQAAVGLAFHEAAALYRKAIVHGEQLGAEALDERAQIEERLAHVLAQAGRSSEAAETYLAAAEGLVDREQRRAAAAGLTTEAHAKNATDGDVAEHVRDLRRMAAEQYLRGGHLDEGLTLLREVLAEHDLPFPASPNRALLSVLWQRARLRLRGLEHARRTEAEIPRAELARVDACWSAALGLAWVDAIRSTDFQIRHARLALDLGEPSRVVRALGTEATFLAAEGGRKNRERSREALALAESLASRIDQPYPYALVGICGAGAACFEGRWREAVDRARDAESMLRGHCTGVAWELLNAHLFSLWALALRGELGELCLALPRLLTEARERGDVLAATSLASGYLNVAWLALDRPSDARARAETAMSLWSRSGVHSQHFLDLFAQAQIDLYTGAYAEALARIEASWLRIARAQMLRVQLIRGQCLHLRGRALLACAAGRAGSERKALVERARADARALRNEDTRWAPPLGDALLAGASELSGDTDGAERLWCRAAAGLGEVDLGLHAAVARWRHATLVGGEGGRREQEGALAWMNARSIVSPERMAEVIAPRGAR